MSLSPWKVEALKQWATLAASGLSVRKLAEATGLTRNKAHWLQKHVRDNGVPEPVAATQGDSADVKEEDASHLLHDFEYYYNDDTDTYVTFLNCAPKPVVVPGHKHRAMKQAYSNWDGQPATINQICRRFEIPRPWFVEYKAVHGWTHDSEPFSNEEMLNRTTEDLVQDALQHKRQQLYQQYEIKKWKSIQRDADRWNSFEQEVLNRMLEVMAENDDSDPLPHVSLGDTDDEFILVMGVTDFHWGSYSWGGESHSPYNREVAERRLFEASSKVIRRLPGNPDEILLPIGSDFFDIDGDRNATTRGTPQDIEGTPTEILVTGCQLMVRYIDWLTQFAPVRVVMMAGNHDRHNGLSLLLYLNAWYRTAEEVDVDLQYTPRTYHEYGNNLIAFSHGDGSHAKPKNLTPIVATEAREMWGRTEHHIAFGGHLHHERVQDVGGLTHYLLPSLCGQDRWHSRNGYTTSVPALQGFMVDKEEGVICSITSRVK